jgi:hypothetical protein
MVSLLATKRTNVNIPLIQGGKENWQNTAGNVYFSYTDTLFSGTAIETNIVLMLTYNMMI